MATRKKNTPDVTTISTSPYPLILISCKSGKPDLRELARALEGPLCEAADYLNPYSIHVHDPAYGLDDPVEIIQDNLELKPGENHFHACTAKLTLTITLDNHEDIVIEYTPAQKASVATKSRKKY